MKEKSIVTKILIAGIFVVFLLLFLIVFSLIKMLVPKKENTIEKTIITNNYSLANIENISFDFKKSNSTFEISDSEELVIVQNTEEEKFYLNYRQKGNTVYIEEDGYIIKPQKKKYIIYIPRTYLNMITINNGFGEININGITNDMVINNNSGKINLNEVSNIKLKDVSGDISFKNVIGNIDVSSSTGNIIIKNITGLINAETITGDILVKDYNVIGDSNFENVSGDIVLELVGESICKINYSNDTGKTLIDENVCVGEFNNINIKNITGMIKIN